VAGPARRRTSPADGEDDRQFFGAIADLLTVCAATAHSGTGLAGS